MSEDENPLLMVHLRSIRTAIVGLALAVLTTGLIISGDSLDFPFLIFSLFVCLYAFVPPFIRA
ncbi:MULTISPECIES: hypothetical protein [unclassified Halorubrum]|uniref:hypothetical protein n=1 Tax=unclassified Halorubrum TaxID=2642239 RepID=UPI00064EB745|nr:MULTISPECIES: hypothetical protein [unclassified Halorubrum]